MKSFWKIWLKSGTIPWSTLAGPRMIGKPGLRPGTGPEQSGRKDMRDDNVKLL